MTHPKHAVSEHAILDVIRERWSPRAFDADRTVDESTLRTLFEAARWAPSSFNEQPWRFVVTHRERSADAYRALFETLLENNRTWAGAAPVLVLVAAATDLQRLNTANRHAWYDAGQAVALLSLQATSLGLGVRQMEGFSRDAVRAVLNVPTGYDAVVVIAIGYTGDPESLPIERHRIAESQPRGRRGVEEFVFEGTWGKPLSIRD